jgi:drug/metabolite transporter (DMT)-like permease
MISTLLNLIVWYSFAAACTIFTRDLASAGFGSLSISLAQFLVGSILSFAVTILSGENKDCFVGIWNTRLKGVVCCYSLGHILTNYSFLVMQPSFSHTVKASEPVFTAILSRILARPNPNNLQLMSLCPIVLGVMIASFSEFAFPWTGLLASLSSNLFFSARNVRAPHPHPAQSFHSTKGPVVPMHRISPTHSSPRPFSRLASTPMPHLRSPGALLWHRRGRRIRALPTSEPR